MKKLFFILLFLICAVVCLGQPIVPRANSSITVQDARLAAQYNLLLPRYDDTTSANAQIGVDSCGAVVFIYSTNSIWYRSCEDGKKWVEVGSGGGGTPTLNDVVLAGNVATDYMVVQKDRADNSIDTGFIINRIRTSGTAGNGIGSSLIYRSQTDIGVVSKTNEIQSYWSNASVASRSARLLIRGVKSGSESDWFALDGEFAYLYGSGTDTLATRAYARSVAGGGGGSGTVTSVGSGFGLSGGPITTTGTLEVDSLIIGTKQWVYNLLDSIPAPNLVVQSAGSGTPIWYTSGDTLFLKTINGATTEADSSLTISGGGGSSLFPTTGTGTATGNVIGDLDGNTLSVQQGGINFISIDPTSGSESLLIQSYNTTAFHNYSFVSLQSTNTDAFFRIEATYNGEEKQGYIELITSSLQAEASYSADTHRFLGSIFYDSPTSGASTDSVLTWDADTKEVRMRDASFYGGGGDITFNTGSTGTDVNWSGSPVSVGGSITLNIPDASTSARGLVTTGSQLFGGVKTFNSAPFFTSGFSTSATTTNANLYVGMGQTAIANNTSQNLFAGASAIAARIINRGSTTYTMLANTSFANIVSGEQLINTAATGTHGGIAGMVLKPPVVSSAGGATVTDMATLWITGVPSGVSSTNPAMAIRADAGSIQLVNGNINLQTAGNKLNIATGSNASVGTSGAMTAGTITINTTAVTSSSIILLTPNGAGSGQISVGTITDGTSFVINSSDGSDTRTVNWLIIN